MTTVLDVVNLALFDAGVVGTGQVASAQDSNLAFRRLNFMLGAWQVERWLVYHLVDVAKVSTGATSYTVGSGGDFNVAVAPDRVEAAFFRQLIQSAPNQIDYPLEQLMSREDYNNIALKQLQSFPSYFFYDSNHPTGTVYFWPVAQATIYEMHLSLKAVLNQFTSLAQTISLPLVYFDALYKNLAVMLRDAYDLPPKPMLVMGAKAALNQMRKANNQISRLTMPNDLVRPGIYNPYSDQIR